MILRRRNPQHHIVGHNRDPVARRHHLHVICLEIQPAVPKLVEHVLPAVQLAVELDKRKVVSERALEEGNVPLLRRVHCPRHSGYFASPCAEAPAVATINAAVIAIAQVKPR